MRLSLRQFIGTPIRDSNNAALLGRVVGVIINPANGEIVALNAEKTRQLIVPTVDVKEVKDGSVWISHHEAICPVDDIVRVRDIVAQRAPVLDAKVFTLSQKPLGTVHDLVFETKHFVVLQLDVAKSILGIPTERKLIDTRQVVRIDRRGVVVNDAAIKKAEKQAILSEMQQVTSATTCRAK